MGRKRTSDPDERDGVRGFERSLGAERPELLDIRATPLPNRRGGSAARSAEPRIVCTLVMDTSGSMYHSGALAAAVASFPQFKASVLGHPLLARKLSFSLVGFDDTVRIISLHQPMADWQVPERLDGGNGTAMGTAILKTLGLQEEHVEELASEGIATQHRVMVLLSDGNPTGEPHAALDDAIRAIKEAEEMKTFSFFPIAVEGSNFDTLSRLSSQRKPLGLARVDFAKLMEWLVVTFNTICATADGDRITLSNPVKHSGNPHGWGYLG